MIDIICCVDVQVDGLGQIQGEDSHDRLRVDDVTSGDEIEIIIKLGEVIYKRFDLVNRIQRNRYCFHKILTFFLSGAEHLFEDILI